MGGRNRPLIDDPLRDLLDSLSEEGGIVGIIRRVHISTDVVNNTRRISPSLTFTYDMSDVELKSITAYVRTFTHGFYFDRNVGGRALGVQEFPGTANYPLFPADPDYTGISDSDNVGNTITQEIRFSKPASADSRWSWIGGLFFSKNRLYTSYDLFTPTNATTEELYGISSYQYFGIPDQPANRVGTYRLYVTNVEEAVYGNLNFNVTDKLRLTGGVRFSNLTQNFWQTNFGQESSDTATSPIATVAGGRHNRPVAPLAGVHYNFTPDGMVFATGAKGSAPAVSTSLSMRSPAPHRCNSTGSR